jgi:hypothetical protein
MKRSCEVKVTCANDEPTTCPCVISALLLGWHNVIKSSMHACRCEDIIVGAG